MRAIGPLFVATLLVLAAYVAADELDHKGVPGLDPPRTVSAEERKQLQPKAANRNDKNVKQIKDSGKTEKISSQIYGGVATQRGQWPWQVYILQDGAYMCGGTLILPQWVLTAAQCAAGRKNFSITLGVTNRTVFEDGRITVETTTKFIHPNYNNNTLNNDIALLRLPLPVVPTRFNYVFPVRLPLLSDARLSFENVAAVVTGWGRYNSTENSTTYMAAANMTVINSFTCASFYPAGVVTSATICANSTTGRSTCQGDIGGPLVYYDRTYRAWTQIGITSFFVANATCGSYPSGFTRVTSYLGFISNIIATNIR